MSVRSFVTAGAVAAVVVTPLLGAGAANAAGRNWTTTQTFHHVKLQECKVPTKDGLSWRIYNRIDARRLGSGVASGMVTVSKGTQQTSTWQVQVRHGRISTVGSVVMKRHSGMTMGGGIGLGQMGDGGMIKVTSIGHC